MARHYGMPYMGSKQKLVDKLVPFILERHPGATDFYDLFGGGASVSLYAVKKYPELNVHYNELSQAIGNLLTFIQEGGHIPLDFVSHEDFFKYRFGNDWYAGFLQTCWSFGNNQKSYLYGTDIEEYKLRYHETVMFGKDNLTWLAEFIKQRYGIEKTLFLNFKRYTTPYQRRIVLNRQLPKLNQLEHFSRIERLLHMQKMPGLFRLNITAGKSYDEIALIGAEPVVYCDPPYENTNEYVEGGFDSKAFYDWVANCNNPVYFSSYEISDKRFKLVKAINTRAQLDHRQRSGGMPYNYEKLYWNGKGVVA